MDFFSTMRMRLRHLFYLILNGGIYPVDTIVSFFLGGVLAANLTLFILSTEESIRLANEMGARLDVLHVLDPYLPHRVLRDLEGAVVDDIHAIATDLREDYALAEPPLLVQTVRRSSTPTKRNKAATFGARAIRAPFHVPRSAG